MVSVVCSICGYIAIGLYVLDMWSVYVFQPWVVGTSVLSGLDKLGSDVCSTRGWCDLVVMGLDMWPM